MQTQWFARAFLAVWAGSLTFLGACLMAGHWLPLPTPDVSAQPDTKFWKETPTGHWMALHFLYTKCPCSRRVLEHVIARRPSQEVRDQIVLIGDESELAARVADQGYIVDLISPAELEKKYGVVAAPLLMIVDPQGQLRYSGGYTDRKQGFAVRYSSIVTDLLHDQDVESLPVYGCAVSKGLQAIVDPLRLKSSSRN